METPSNSGHGHTIKSGSRNIIYNVYNYFQKLTNEVFLNGVNFAQVQEVTGQACGISQRSVQRICREAKECKNNDSPVEFETPGKIRKRESCFLLDDFNRDIIQRTIYQYYNRNKIATIKKLKKEIRTNWIQISHLLLFVVFLKKIGFNYKKNEGWSILPNGET